MDFIDIFHMKRSRLVNGRYYYNRMKLGDKGYEIDTVYKDKFQERERDASHWKIIDIDTPISKVDY